MKCYIKVENNGYDEVKNCLPTNIRYTIPSINRFDGVTNMIWCDKDMVNFLKPYIKTEKYDKRELHFKNNKEMGSLIEKFTSFRIEYNSLLKEGYKSEYYNELLEEAKYYYIDLALIKSLDKYLMYSYMCNVPFDEIKLINNYLNRFYKNKLILTDEIYNDFIEISDFILNNITGHKVYHSKELVTAFNSLTHRKDNTIRTIINGRIDFIDENCIYDIKCTTKDSKYVSIIQVLIYLCMIYLNDFFQLYDIKYVKIINPILNVIHTINIDDFGKDNILKFFKLMFVDYLENKEVKIINN